MNFDQNKHLKYMSGRFPELAAELILIPDEHFRDNFGFDPANWDEKSDADVIFEAFDWSATPQGGMFWADIYANIVTRREK